MNGDSNEFCYGFRFGPTSALRSCLGGLLFAALAFSATAQAGKDPKNATEWFQRANDQMDLRAPGSTPFSHGGSVSCPSGHRSG